MTEHDSWCPATLGRYVSGTGFTPNECQCALIARVRADERERAATRMYLQREHLRTDLRAKVLRLTLLRLEGWDVVLLGDVLDLIDGASSTDEAAQPDRRSGKGDQDG